MLIYCSQIVRMPSSIGFLFQYKIDEYMHAWNSYCSDESHKSYDYDQKNDHAKVNK